MHLLRFAQKAMIAATACTVLASAAPVTNTDVEKLLAAGMDDGVILNVIAGGEPQFDTSVDALIALKKKGATPAILAAITGGTAKKPAPAEPVSALSAVANEKSMPSVQAANPVETMSPSDIYLIEKGEKKVMRYLNPEMRTAARAFGMGGVANYAVLRSSAAALRITERSPTFVISVPEKAQVESYFTLASFAVRRNNSREVMVGGGYMSYSSGVHPDRIVAVRSIKAEDQAAAQKGFVIYTVTPVKPLPVGEYAVILYTAELHQLVASWFTGVGNAYFDFGVDS
jgi:hypothetical protein